MLDGDDVVTKVYAFGLQDCGEGRGGWRWGGVRGLKLDGGGGGAGGGGRERKQG